MVYLRCNLSAMRGSEQNAQMGHMSFPDPLRPHEHSLTVSPGPRSRHPSGRTAGGDGGGGAQHSVAAAARPATKAAANVLGSPRGDLGTMVMIYGSAEACRKTQCGLVFIPHGPSSAHDEPPSPAFHRY